MAEENVNAEWLECEICHKRKPDVGETTDPYSLELYDEEVEIVACDDCVQERADDI